MKKIYLVFLLIVSVAVCYAQDDADSGSSSGFSQVKGDFTGAIMFGRANFLTSGLVNTRAAGVYQSWNVWYVPGTAPYANTISGNNDASNMVGGEARYFVSDKFAVKLSGGAIIRNTPAGDNIPAVIDPDAPNASWIPAYNAVIADNTVDLNVNVGGEWHFPTSIERLHPYVGLTLPFYYGRRSALDPTITDDGVVVDVGVRHVEMVGFGAAAVAGVDYYLMEGLYFGLEIKPINYLYAFNTKHPAPGLETLEAETHTWSFMVQPFLKVGFKF